MNLFENSISISDAQINELFTKKKDTEMDLILRILSLVIYQNSTNTDIIEMYRLLGPEKFSQVIVLLDGRPTKFPSGTEFKESLILSLIYYYKEIRNFTWDEIKEKIPFEISGISYGIRIKQLNTFIRQKMEEIFKKIDKKEKVND